MNATIEQFKAGETERVDASACCFTMSHVEFMAGSAGEGSLPFSMLARSDQPVDHWYWGRCVHDFAGMKHKSSIVVDYCHNWNQVIGVANEFKVEKNTGLQVGGFVHLKSDPAAIENKIAENVKAEPPVPYESSIYFDPDFEIIVEHVAEGAQTVVNDQTFDGPITVFREWHLKAVSICPHGEDRHAETAFSQANSQVKLSYKGKSTMSKSNDTTAPATPPETASNNNSPETTAADTTETNTETTSSDGGGDGGGDSGSDGTGGETELSKTMKRLSELQARIDQRSENKTELDQINERLDSMFAQLDGEPEAGAEIAELKKSIDQRFDKIESAFAHVASSSGAASSGAGEGGGKSGGRNDDDFAKWAAKFGPKKK